MCHVTIESPWQLDPHPVASVRSPCLSWLEECMEATSRVRSGLPRILLRVGRLFALVSMVWIGDL